MLLRKRLLCLPCQPSSSQVLFLSICTLGVILSNLFQGQVKHSLSLVSPLLRVCTHLQFFMLALMRTADRKSLPIGKDVFKPLTPHLSQPHVRIWDNRQRKYLVWVLNLFSYNWNWQQATHRLMLVSVSKSSFSFVVHIWGEQGDAVLNICSPQDINYGWLLIVDEYGPRASLITPLIMIVTCHHISIAVATMATP